MEDLFIKKEEKQINNLFIINDCYKMDFNLKENKEYNEVYYLKTVFFSGLRFDVFIVDGYEYPGTMFTSNVLVNGRLTSFPIFIGMKYFKLYNEKILNFVIGHEIGHAIHMILYVFNHNIKQENIINDELEEELLADIFPIINNFATAYDILDFINILDDDLIDLEFQLKRCNLIIENYNNLAEYYSKLLNSQIKKFKGVK